MALPDLYHLADFGLGGPSPGQLEEIAERAEDLCFERGDVRFCIIAKALVRLGNLWADDVVVPAHWIPQIDDLLEGQLPAILAAAPDHGRQLALAFLQDVRALTDRLMQEGH